MNIKAAGKLSSVLAIGAALAGCATNTQVIPMGNNTYTITREAVTVFSRGPEELKAEARQDAADFCAAKGKGMKVVELTVEKANRANGFAKARIVFQAVDATAVQPVAVAPADSVDKLYADLIKLNDLRQKSILTDEEFQGQKKKVLDKSP